MPRRTVRMTALPIGIARNANVMACCVLVLKTQPRLFDGWPSGRLFDETFDAGRVERIRRASPVLQSIHAMDVQIFDCCAELAAKRRIARYSRYAAQVERAMSTVD